MKNARPEFESVLVVLGFYVVGGGADVGVMLLLCCW